MFYSSASDETVVRGFVMANEECVHTCHSVTVGEDVYRASGTVKDPETDELYATTIDIEKPSNSTCTCGCKDGTLGLCAHKIALFFAAVPDAAAEYYAEMRMKRDSEAAKSLEPRIDALLKKMNWEELRRLLTKLMMDFDEDELLEIIESYENS